MMSSNIAILDAWIIGYFYQNKTSSQKVVNNNEGHN